MEKLSPHELGELKQILQDRIKTINQCAPTDRDALSSISQAVSALLALDKHLPNVDPTKN